LEANEFPKLSAAEAALLKIEILKRNITDYLK